MGSVKLVFFLTDKSFIHFTYCFFKVTTALRYRTRLFSSDTILFLLPFLFIYVILYFLRLSFSLFLLFLKSFFSRYVLNVICAQVDFELRFVLIFRQIWYLCSTNIHYTSNMCILFLSVLNSLCILCTILFPLHSISLTTDESLDLYNWFISRIQRETFWNSIVYASIIYHVVFLRVFRV